ncbi:MAG: F0F1 ATP synthase subunit B [Burkholderiales bacterium]|nr:F0F1 ATP synthase subunit B [Burkholderiales bacterium]
MNINATLFGQVIWFALFIWFVMKVVWPYFQRIIAERQKTIADGLAAAERGRQELESAGQRAQDSLAEARSRAAEVIALAEKRAAEIVEEAKNAAKAEGERLIAGAKAEVEQQATRAKEQLREHVAALAVAGAGKILRREVDAKAHAELLAQLKQEL